jgi:hypothetical protein
MLGSVSLFILRLRPIDSIEDFAGTHRKPGAVLSGIVGEGKQRRIAQHRSYWYQVDLQPSPLLAVPRLNL